MGEKMITKNTTHQELIKKNHCNYSMGQFCLPALVCHFLSVNKLSCLLNSDNSMLSWPVPMMVYY